MNVNTRKINDQKKIKSFQYNIRISLILCTFNRADIIYHTIKHLLDTLNDNCFLEILIVDNNSIDNTAKVIKKIKLNDGRIKYFLEHNQGLSYARNRGIQESNSDWLFFLDDDAKLVDGSLTQILDMINSNRFDLVTGIWKAWYKSPPPKWLPHSTGNYILKGTNEIREIGNDYVSGGVMLINKQKLLEIGGFPTHLGMTGNKVAYGEETYVEEEFKKQGWKVGINPNIVIDHLVGEHKYKLSWHLEAAFAKGRDNQIISLALSKTKARIDLIRCIVLGWIKPMIKLVFRSNYYWQNFIIDYVGGYRYFQGVLQAHVSESKNKLA